MIRATNTWKEDKEFVPQESHWSIPWNNEIVRKNLSNYKTRTYSLEYIKNTWWSQHQQKSKAWFWWQHVYLWCELERWPETEWQFKVETFSDDKTGWNTLRSKNDYSIQLNKKRHDFDDKMFESLWYELERWPETEWQFKVDHQKEEKKHIRRLGIRLSVMIATKCDHHNHIQNDNAIWKVDLLKVIMDDCSELIIHRWLAYGYWGWLWRS